MTEASRGGHPPRVVGFIFGRYADYVWGLRPLFLICLFLFASSLTMSFYLGDKIPDEMPEEIEAMLQYLEQLNIPMIFLFILFNNLFNCFIWMVLGVFVGLPPLYFIVRNGFVVGRVSYITSLSIGLPLTVAILIPHGIIEIPTVLLSAAAGMGLGYQLINRLRGRGSLRAEFGKALRLFIWRIAPLLLIAAAVEIMLIAASSYIFSFG